MTKRNVLVAGGAGYIGSHAVLELIRNRDNAVIYDDLSNSCLPEIDNIECINGDIGDYNKVIEVLQENKIDVVMHFATSSYVEESISDPKKYYVNNISKGISFLNAIVDSGVRKLIYSSSCAIYGIPSAIPIKENEKKSPINPYGQTKAMYEQILSDYDKAYGLRSICLRYFNAAGADAAGKIGERHEPETHVLPLLMQTAMGHREEFSVFGTDYDTRDGTCIRDYVHVTDLAIAHLKAIEYLFQNDKSEQFNLGSGNGATVMELIGAIEKTAGIKLNVKKKGRRPGDADILIADSTKAQTMLNWVPTHSSIDNIVRTAWAWHTGAGRQ